MTTILTEIISILVAGITGIATGIGEGLTKLVQSIFLTVSETGAVEGLSTFGGLIIVFAGKELPESMVTCSRIAEKNWKAEMLIRGEGVSQPQRIEGAIIPPRVRYPLFEVKRYAEQARTVSA